MSETNVYIVPGDSLRDRQGLRTEVVAFLENTGIVAGFYDADLGWYAAGKKSHDLFAIPVRPGPAFEYLIVYDGVAARFVPDSCSAGYGATCLACGASIEDELYELLDEQGDDDDPVDVTGRALRCLECHALNELGSLSCEIETALTRFYLTFCHVDTLVLSPSVLQGLQRLLGSPLRILSERL